jgi:hypothetical protein
MRNKKTHKIELGNAMCFIEPPGCQRKLPADLKYRYGEAPVKKFRSGSCQADYL